MIWFIFHIVEERAILREKKNRKSIITLRRIVIFKNTMVLHGFLYSDSADSADYSFLERHVYSAIFSFFPSVSVCLVSRGRNRPPLGTVLRGDNFPGMVFSRYFSENISNSMGFANSSAPLFLFFSWIVCVFCE